jgi:hypothetical protein
VVRAAAAIAGHEVRITEAAGVVVLTAGDWTLAANFTPQAAPSSLPGLAALPPESAIVHVS